MKYKAIVFDIDGTAIPNTRNGQPSEELKTIIKKAQENFIVSVATGRVYNLCKDLLEQLNLKDPCIISGGAQIVDPITGDVLWEKLMSKKSVNKILEVLIPYEYEIFFSDDIESQIAKEKKADTERFVNIKYISSKDSEKIMRRLETIPNIIAHKVSSWKKGTFDIHITHLEATKDHAIKLFLQKLSLVKKEVIGVGDSDNDLPIFDSVGLKIAMGNSTKKLKEKADFIGSTVDEDGLVGIIRDNLLNQV
jgi:HAD superfamily hydrolase (TIGR01484 family)